MRTDGFYIRGHFQNASIGDLLAVADLHQFEFPLRGGIHKDGRDDERAEIITLARFIDADTFDGLDRPTSRHRVLLLENITKAR